MGILFSHSASTALLEKKLRDLSENVAEIREGRFMWEVNKTMSTKPSAGAEVQYVESE